MDLVLVSKTSCALPGSIFELVNKVKLHTVKGAAFLWSKFVNINIFICVMVNKCYNEIHPKKIFHLLTSRFCSVTFEAISSIP